MLNPEKFSYGAELELGDWDVIRCIPLLEKLGAQHNTQDYTICNSNGIANDPHLKFNKFGGEINTKPFNSIDEEVNHIMDIYHCLDKYSINYTSNLHLHIMVPHLVENVDMLKKLATWIYNNQEDFFWYIEKIPHEEQQKYDSEEAYLAARWREKRRHKSHQTKMSARIYNNIMKAKTPEEVYLAHAVIGSDGIPKFNIVTRNGINLMQLFNETGTVEFRCFPGCDDPVKIKEAFEIITMVIKAACYDDFEVEKQLWDYLENKYEPIEFKPFNYELDKTFKQTGLAYVSRKECVSFLKKHFAGQDTMPILGVNIQEL